MTTTLPPFNPDRYPHTTEAACVAVVAALTEDQCRTLLAGSLAEYVDVAGLYPDADVTASLRVLGVPSTPVAELLAGVAERVLTLQAGTEAAPLSVLNLAVSALLGERGTGHVAPPQYAERIRQAGTRWGQTITREAEVLG